MQLQHTLRAPVAIICTALAAVTLAVVDAARVSLAAPVAQGTITVCEDVLTEPSSATWTTPAEWGDLFTVTYIAAESSPGTGAARVGYGGTSYRFFPPETTWTLATRGIPLTVDPAELVPGDYVTVEVCGTVPAPTATPTATEVPPTPTFHPYPYPIFFPDIHSHSGN